MEYHPHNHHHHDNPYCGVLKSIVKGSNLCAPGVDDDGDNDGDDSTFYGVERTLPLYLTCTVDLIVCM